MPVEVNGSLLMSAAVSWAHSLPFLVASGYVASERRE